MAPRTGDFVKDEARYPRWWSGANDSAGFGGVPTEAELQWCPTWAAMQEDPDPLGLGKDPGYFNPLRCEIMAGRMLFLHIGEFYSDEEEEQVRLGAHNSPTFIMLLMDFEELFDSIDSDDAQVTLELNRKLSKVLNETSDDPVHISKCCGGCYIPPSKFIKLKACSRCHLTSYCSTACQKKRWEEHQFICSEEQLILSRLEAMAMSDPDRFVFSTAFDTYSPTMREAANIACYPAFRLWSDKPVQDHVLHIEVKHNPKITDRSLAFEVKTIELISRTTARFLITKLPPDRASQFDDMLDPVTIARNMKLADDHTQWVCPIFFTSLDFRNRRGGDPHQAVQFFPGVFPKIKKAEVTPAYWKRLKSETWKEDFIALSRLSSLTLTEVEGRDPLKGDPDLRTMKFPGKAESRADRFAAMRVPHAQTRPGVVLSTCMFG